MTEGKPKARREIPGPRLSRRLIPLVIFTALAWMSVGSADAGAWAGPGPVVLGETGPAPAPGERTELKKRWRSLSPEKKEELRRRMRWFNRLTPRDRELFRRRYRQLKKMSPRERQRLLRQLDRWDRLSPGERKRIRKKFLNRHIPPPPQGRPRPARTTVG